MSCVIVDEAAPEDGTCVITINTAAFRSRIIVNGAVDESALFGVGRFSCKATTIQSGLVEANFTVDDLRVAL